MIKIFYFHLLLKCFDILLVFGEFRNNLRRSIQLYNQNHTERILHSSISKYVQCYIDMAFPSRKGKKLALSNNILRHT